MWEASEVPRPSKRPPREDLVRLYVLEWVSQGEIARHYGVSESTVSRWRRHYGIRRPAAPPRRFLVEMLYRWAKILELEPETLRNMLIRLGPEPERPPREWVERVGGRKNQDPNLETLAKLRGWPVSWEKIGKRYGVTKVTARQWWIDGAMEQLDETIELVDE